LSVSLIAVDSDGDGQIDNEEAELWASDFDAGSFHNCGNVLTFSFSADTTDKFLIFDCSDIGRQFVDMWVTDVITGAQDFCTAFIDVQDAGLCPDQMRVVVEGQIFTETIEDIQAVEVNLGDAINVDTTDNSGEYAFRNMPLGGTYEITPVSGGDFINGVNTVDLIMIQRHIIGLEQLDSPYKLIAADVNNSNNINGLDLVELRKLIIGIYEELPNNESIKYI